MRDMNQAPNKVVERLADGLSGTSLFAGVSMSLAELNTFLETLTLIVGLIAGIFALFFHIQRWKNSRAKKSQSREE